jgi:hypothetical protein
MHREIGGMRLTDARVCRSDEERRLVVVGALAVDIEIQPQKAVELYLILRAQEIRPVQWFAGA